MRELNFNEVNAISGGGELAGVLGVAALLVAGAAYLKATQHEDLLADSLTLSLIHEVQLSKLPGYAETACLTYGEIKAAIQAMPDVSCANN